MLKQQKDSAVLEKEMQVNNQQRTEITQINLKGRMVYEHSTFFAEQLQGHLLPEGGLYLVDVNSVERIDSTGFGVLISFAKLVSKQGGGIGFVVSQPFMRELFLMAQFDRVFPVAETVEAATAQLMGGFKGQIVLDQY